MNINYKNYPTGYEYSEEVLDNGDILYKYSFNSEETVTTELGTFSKINFNVNNLNKDLAEKDFEQFLLTNNLWQ